MKNIKKTTKQDFITYFAVIAAFVILTVMGDAGMLSRSLKGQLVPICCYIVMAVSLNLTVGILGELSLGHAGFMSVGAFSGIIAAMSLQAAIPSVALRLVIALVVGAVFAGVAGALIGIPVLRLRGDYLAIVTLAFGEIIKELINCLIVGVDSEGLHVIFNVTGAKTVNDLHMLEGGRAIIGEMKALQDETSSMMQGMEEMSQSARKISETGKALSEISALMDDSISGIGAQVDKFRV